MKYPKNWGVADATRGAAVYSRAPWAAGICGPSCCRLHERGAIQLEYASADWRKNVKATVSVVNADAELVARARQTTTRLGLVLACVDYIVNEQGATLLEVNAYPGLDDVPEAAEAFLEMAGAWRSKLGKAEG